MAVNTVRNNPIYPVILLISLVLAFWFRWQFLHKINLYPDEFVTLLAMDMITQKGAPILPSGLFYEHGLLYSYLAGATSLLGDAVFWGRFTSLILGLITIALTYFIGQRWLSPMVGALAAIGLALAPAAIHWSGRVRMYALLQVLVLLTIWLMMEGLFRNRKRMAWLSVLAYVGALLTQFVSLALLPPLTVAETIGFMTQPNRRGWYRDPQLWLRGLAVGTAVLVAILVKRVGQPKGLAPLEADNAIGGIWQIFTTYTSFSVNIIQSWQAIAPFFLDVPNLIFTIFIPVACIAALWPKPRYGASLFLLIILSLTTLEVVLIAPSDRRDDKYLFMLMPVLCLLGGQGIRVIIDLITSQLSQTSQHWVRAGCVVIVSLILVFASRSHINELLSDVGEDYETTFVYVAENMGQNDAILTGTPTAAYHFLGRNDLYAVQAGGIYDYRILNQPEHGLVERWLGSPWIKTMEELNAAFAKQTVWLVLERWGLLIQYYDPLFMQNILAQTEFIREDNGIIALKSQPNPRLLQPAPAVPANALLNGTAGDAGQLTMRGYTLEDNRLTLYWEAINPVSLNYTVFVNVQNAAGETVLQTDHAPLGSIYPTTLWPAGQLIRETSQLDLPTGQYHLRVGMYLLETGERLWVPSDETLQNMVYLGEIEVP